MSFIAADQGSLASVKRAVETFLARSDRLDVLIANAGIMDVPGKSEDGYEIQFGTNVVAHALFFRLLLSTLLKSADPRFVSLTSELHTATGKTGLELSELRSDAKGTLGAGLAGYDRSKFGNLVYGQECARRFPTITVANIHPGAPGTSLLVRGRLELTPSVPLLSGIVKTDLISELSFLKRTFINIATYFWALTPEQGAYSELWAATAPRKDIKSGVYYIPVGQEKVTKLKAADPTEGKNLYDWMETELTPFLAKAFV